MIGRTTFIFAALIVLLAAVGLGGFFWLRTSLPQMKGSVTLAGLDKPVEVVRDAHSVPHIFAETEEDAYFALGFVHAQDRLWQMEFLRRLGAGRLAEVLGEPLVGADRFFRTLGLYRVAEASVEALSPKVRAAFEAYAAGVNAFLDTRRGALPPEFVLLRFKPEPWRVADSLVWGRVLAIRLSRNWRSELLRVRLDEALTSKGLAPDLLAELWPDDPPGAPVTLDNATRSARLLLDRMWDAVPPQLISDGASNGWIVHGRLTDTGKPILANDPHLDFEVPGLWYLVRLEAPGLSLTGATVPGMLLTILGHNGSIAWGVTNAGGDVADLFVETLDPEDPERYLTPAGPAPFETRDEVIPGAQPARGMSWRSQHRCFGRTTAPSKRSSPSIGRGTGKISWPRLPTSTHRIRTCSSRPGMVTSVSYRRAGFPFARPAMDACRSLAPTVATIGKASSRRRCCRVCTIRRRGESSTPTTAWSTTHTHT